MATNPDDNLNADPDAADDTPNIVEPKIVVGDGRELSALRAAVAASRQRRVTRLSWRRRARQWFSRERLRDMSTTLALVIPLTMLIWVWAERAEQVQDERRVFYVELHSADPGKTLTVDAAAIVNTTATLDSRDGAVRRRVAVDVGLNGPRAGVETLLDALKDPAKAIFTLEVTDLPAAGEPLDVQLKPLIDQQPLIRDQGVTVRTLTPETIRVAVDEVAEAELPLKLPSDLSSIVQIAKVEPAKIKVRGPKQTIEHLQSSGALVAELDLKPDSPAVAAARPTVPTTSETVRVRPINAPGLVMDVTQAQVALQGTADQEETLDAVPILVLKPWTITADPRLDRATLSNVKVRGRADVVRRLKNATRPGERLEAVLRISVDDLGKKGRRLPTFPNCPKEVTVVPESIGEIGFDMTDGGAGVTP